MWPLITVFVVQRSGSKKCLKPFTIFWIPKLDNNHLLLLRVFFATAFWQSSLSINKIGFWDLWVRESRKALSWLLLCDLIYWKTSFPVLGTRGAHVSQCHSQCHSLSQRTESSTSECGFVLSCLLPLRPPSFSYNLSSSCFFSYHFITSTDSLTRWEEMVFLLFLVFLLWSKCYSHGAPHSGLYSYSVKSSHVCSVYVTTTWSKQFFLCSDKLPAFIFSMM